MSKFTPIEVIEDITKILESLTERGRVIVLKFLLEVAEDQNENPN